MMREAIRVGIGATVDHARARVKRSISYARMQRTGAQSARGERIGGGSRVFSQPRRETRVEMARLVENRGCFHQRSVWLPFTNCSGQAAGGQGKAVKSSGRPWKGSESSTKGSGKAAEGQGKAVEMQQKVKERQWKGSGRPWKGSGKAAGGQGKAVERQRKAVERQ